MPNLSLSVGFNWKLSFLWAILCTNISTYYFCSRLFDLKIFTWKFWSISVSQYRTQLEQDKRLEQMVCKNAHGSISYLTHVNRCRFAHQIELRWQNLQNWSGPDGRTCCCKEETGHSSQPGSLHAKPAYSRASIQKDLSEKLVTFAYLVKVSKWEIGFSCCCWYSKILEQLQLQR